MQDSADHTFTPRRVNAPGTAEAAIRSPSNRARLRFHSDAGYLSTTIEDRSLGAATRRILVIDDDESTRHTFAIALRLIGFSVVAVESGLQAIRAVKQASFDLMLVDLQLPDMSGIDVVRSLHEGERPPFVIISGFLSIARTVEAMRLGAVTVI